MSSRSLSALSEKTSRASHTFEFRLPSHPKVLITMSNKLFEWGYGVIGLPAEGAMTNVELVLRRLWWPLLAWIACCEPIKVRASSRDIAIAEIMVKVFPKPMSSASIPPLGESGFVDLLDPEMASS